MGESTNGLRRLAAPSAFRAGNHSWMKNLMNKFTGSESPLDMFYHWESSKPDAVYLRQ